MGLRLLTHKEAAEEIPRIRQRKAYRQLGRALRETTAVDHSALPDQIRLALIRQRQNIAQQRREIGRSRRESLHKASATHPVRHVLRAV